MNLNNLKVSDFTFNSDDIFYAFDIIKEWKYAEAKHTLSANVRKFVLGIIILSKEFNIQTSWNDYLEDNLFNALENSENLIYIWISKIVKDILENNWKKLFFTPDEIEDMIDLDSQTGFPNIRKFLKDLRWKKKAYIIKINNFSKINSLYWYITWNEILGKIILELIKFEELWYTLYRISAMEFWLIPKNWSQSQVIKNFIGNKNHTFCIKIAWVETELEIPINLSAWWVESEFPCTNADTFLNKAFIAIWESEKKWKFTLFTEGMSTELKEKHEKELRIYNQLIHALENWKIYPFFQPIRNNESWKNEKYELLIRMEDENGQIISPDIFLPVAKKYWLMHRVTKIAILSWINKIKESWKNISINLDENDLLDNNIILYIIRVLERKKISWEKLTVEILESVTEEDNNTLLKNILKLKKAWIKIAIDDFWTWYSNYVRIVKFSPDFIKIDGSLITDINKNKTKQRVVRSMVEFSHSIFAKVIAEKVETEKEQNTLEILWVWYSQWYLFWKPSKQLHINN